LKKEAKTFATLVFASSKACAKVTKVFWFPPGGRRLFFKKELLSFFSTPLKESPPWAFFRG
jgi:hypothetical protein